jgi:hypothetical protein
MDFGVTDKPAIGSILMFFIVIFVIILCNINPYFRPVFLSSGEMPLIDPKCVKHIFALETFTSGDWNPRLHQYEKFFSSGFIDQSRGICYNNEPNVLILPPCRSQVFY